MSRTIASSTIALALLIGATACGGPERSSPDGEAAALDPALMQQEFDPEMMELLMEMQELQQKLGPIQQQAMQDEALAAQLTELQDHVEGAMRAMNADLFVRIDRFQAEMAAASEAGDQERIQAMMMDAYQMQEEIDALQDSVLEQPEIKQRVTAFEAARRARIIAIDPEAAALLDRMEEIMAALDG